MKSEFAACLLALAFISGCSAAPPYNPFKVARSDIQGKIKTIALAPIKVTSTVENTAAVRGKFESLITAKLQTGGFKVIPSDEYTTTWNPAVEKLGAVYDPATGKRNDKKFTTTFEYTAREVHAKTKADAILFSAIVTVNADFYSNLAEWHGTTDYVRPEGVWATFSGPQAQGTVGALSL